VKSGSGAGTHKQNSLVVCAKSTSASGRRHSEGYGSMLLLRSIGLVGTRGGGACGLSHTRRLERRSCARALAHLQTAATLHGTGECAA